MGFSFSPNTQHKYHVSPRGASTYCVDEGYNSSMAKIDSEGIDKSVICGKLITYTTGFNNFKSNLTRDPDKENS